MCEGCGVKERPIIFSGPMVRAILEWRKTQTRRVVTPQPEERLNAIWKLHPNQEGCPYGKPGDRLWVRESWEQVHPCQVAHGRFSISGEAGIPGPPPVTYQVIYRADGEYPRVHFSPHERPYRVACSGEDCPKSHTHPAEKWHGWIPSIHMPRKFSRITLEIEQVRVQRVQGITEKDAIAEGSQISVSELPKTCQQATWTERQQFSRIWDSINSKRGYGWEVNPWVWCLTFKRVSA